MRDGRRARSFDPEAVVAAYLADPEVRRPKPSKLEQLISAAERNQAFAAEVLAAYGEQELHRGARWAHGLTAADAAYATAMVAWAGYTARYARWADDPAHRNAAAAVGKGVALTAHESSMLAGQPARPQQPNPASMPRPPDWPAQVGSLVADIGTFFRARRP